MKEHYYRIDPQGVLTIKTEQWGTAATPLERERSFRLYTRTGVRRYEQFLDDLSPDDLIVFEDGRKADDVMTEIRYFAKKTKGLL